jgi:hypothetical protein
VVVFIFFLGILTHRQCRFLLWLIMGYKRKTLAQKIRREEEGMPSQSAAMFWEQYKIKKE